MSTKRCNSCDTIKPASDFHIRAASKDGLSAKCRHCQREYDAGRAKLPHRVAARAAYAKTEAGIAAANAAKIRYMQRNPLKRAAHIAVGNALRDGKLSREPCAVCSNPAAEAHHDDYSKPLDVVWLCCTHHKARHRELAAAGVNP